MFLNKYVFYSVRLIASRQTHKLEGNSWSVVHDCLIIRVYSQLTSISGGLLPHSQPEGRRRAVVTGTHGCIYGWTDDVTKRQGNRNAF